MLLFNDDYGDDDDDDDNFLSFTFIWGSNLSDKVNSICVLEIQVLKHGNMSVFLSSPNRWATGVGSLGANMMRTNYL